MVINPLWYVCLLTRSLISLFIYFSNFFKSEIITILTSVALLSMGIGFVYKAIYGSNNEIQVAKVFWHNVRAIHGIFYILSAIYLYLDQPEISAILVFTDILFSILYRIVMNK